MIYPFVELPYYAFFLAALPMAAFGGGMFHQYVSTAGMPFKKTGIYTTVVALPLFILPYTGPQAAIWLVPEVLTIGGIPKTEHVLQQQGQELIVYDPDLHTILRVPIADVSHRQFCSIRSFTLAERLFGSPQGRPLCPRSS